MKTFYLTNHVIEQANAKGIDLETIQYVINHPSAVTPVTGHGDQSRYIGLGIAVIVSDDNGAVITVYLDRVKTPLRPDQIARGEQIRRTH